MIKFGLHLHRVGLLLREKCQLVRRAGRERFKTTTAVGLQGKVNIPSSNSTFNMASYPAWLYAILEKYSTDKYRIEYDSNLSNHLAHGVISLFRLGEDESRVQQFIDHYIKKLEVPTEDDLLDDGTDPKDLLGNFSHFNLLMKHYKNQLQHCKGDLGVLVGQEYPKLSAGLSNVALHGLIHLGYGFSVRSEKIVLEGLAYSHYSCTPLGLVDDFPGPDLRTLGKGDTDIVTVLDRVRENVDLRATVMAESKDPTKNRKSTGFQNKMAALLDYHSPVVFDYVHSVKFPDFWDPTKLGPEEVSRICHWLLDCAVTVYVKSRVKNDFFFIHGVTGAWSFCQVVPHMRDEMQILKAVRVFVATLLGAYVARGAPQLDADEDVKEDFPELLKTATAEERDEHIYKLVQVCYERSQENEALKDLYRKACGIAVKYDLVVAAPADI